MEAASQSSQISLAASPVRDTAPDRRLRAVSSVSAESLGIDSGLTENAGGAHDGILRVRSGLAFEAQRLFEIEGDHRLLGVLQHEVAQRADGDLRGDLLTLRLAQLRMARVDFLLRRGDELIEQIVGLHAETLAAADFDVGARLVFFAQVVAEFGGAARGQRDHLVGKMRVVVGGLAVAEAAQGFDDRVLRLRLAGIDDVVDLRDVAEVRMILLAVRRGNPAVVAVRIAVELAISEVAPQQAELPHVVGDVFADVADGAVGADDDFLIFFCDLLLVCALGVLCG